MNHRLSQFCLTGRRWARSLFQPRLWWADSDDPAYRHCADCSRAWAWQGAVVSRDAISVVQRLEVDGHGYFAKRYVQPGKGWRRWFGRSRCRAEWENLLLFRRWRIPTPELVAYGEQWSDDGYRGVLLTAELVGTAGLDVLAERLRNGRWRAALFDRLSGYLATMHRHGFAHGDLNWRNLLITATETPSIYFIDCPGGRFWPWPLLTPKIVKDLWMLDKLAPQYLSRTQRLRFYKRYRSVVRLQADDKRLLRAVLGKRKP